jgi:CRISPR-associated protein Cmr2
MDNKNKLFPLEYNAGEIGRVFKSEEMRPYAKIWFLTSTLHTQYKELSRSYYRDIIDKTKGEYKSDEIIPQSTLHESIMPEKAPSELLRHLPFGSWLLKFTFQLEKPYISRDDAPFYIIDNPVRKDKVYKIPMVSSAQWKGTLQSVMARGILSSENTVEFMERRLMFIRLFGNDKDVMAGFFEDQRDAWEKEFRKQLNKFYGVKKITDLHRSGRLRFFPSFFDDIGLEIINPHDREKKTGINPIYFECVPGGGVAQFKLLYVPLDIMAKPKAEIIKEIADDWKLLKEGIKDAFTLYGFGGKISSGFGVAVDSFVEQAELYCKGMAINMTNETQQLPKEPVLPEVVQSFYEKYPDEDRSFSKKAKAWSKDKKKRPEYTKAKEAYLKFTQEHEQYEQKLSAIKDEETDLKIRSFTDLADVTLEESR